MWVHSSEIALFNTAVKDLFNGYLWSQTWGPNTILSDFEGKEYLLLKTNVDHIIIGDFDGEVCIYKCFSIICFIYQ